MIGRATRVLAGGLLLWQVIAGASLRGVPDAARVAGGLVLLVTLWMPGAGLALLAGLTPAAMLLAGAPVQASELLAWAFLAAWLLRVWAPLAHTGRPALVSTPAWLYATAVVTSWLAVTIRNAGGIDPAALPRFIARALGTDHLALTSAEPETATMLLALTGLALLFAAAAIVREEARAARWTATAFAGVMAVLSLVTVGAIVQQWQGYDYAGWFIARYARNERYTRHLLDLNAAGSQYALATLVALAFVSLDRARRWPWLALLVLMLPGMWLTGSRSAGLVSTLAGGALLLIAKRGGLRLSGTRRVVAVTVVLVALAAGGVVLARGANTRDSAGRSMRFRVQFTQTSARMLASAPLLGVGVGHYHERSGEFMPAELREVYGHENAHNYFAQQFAELGVIGGGAFLWLAIGAVAWAWPILGSGGLAARGTASASSAAGIGLLAGSVGYLVTCVTGHPLLVPEAALPFWIVLGGAVGAAGPSAVPARPHRGAGPRALQIVALLAGIVLVAATARATLTLRDQPPPERGFSDVERAPDGRRMRWTSRHAVVAFPARPGYFRLVVRAADVTGAPFELQTEVDGQLVDRRVVPADRWVTLDLPVRPRGRSTARYSRVDLRVNRTWTRTHRDGRRDVTEPVGVMVAEARLVRAASQ